MRAPGGGEPAAVGPVLGRASAMAGGPEAACDGPNGHGHGTADGLRPGRTSAERAGGGDSIRIGSSITIVI